MLSSASDKEKLFAENFSKSSNLDDSGIILPIFPSRTNLKLHNISVSPKMVKKVIMNLDLSKASGPDCIPVVALKKNCEPELSYILVELFSVFRSLVFQIVGRFHQWSLYLKMLEKGLQLKTTTLLVLWHLIYLRLLIGFGMLVYFTNLSLMEFQVRYLTLFLLFSVIRQLQVVLEGKPCQEYPINVGAPQGFIIGPTLLLLYINDLPEDVIFNIAIYADDATLYFKCGQASDLWQQLELASELESDLQDTVDQGKKWLVDFNAGKTQLVSFYRSNNNGSIDVKMDGSVLEEKSSFKMLGLIFSSKLDWGSYIISIAKTASKKIGALIHSMKFLSPALALYLYKSTIHACMEYCCHIWVGAPSCYLEFLVKLQKRICRTVGPSLATSLEPLADR